MTEIWGKGGFERSDGKLFGFWSLQSRRDDKWRTSKRCPGRVSVAWQRWVPDYVFVGQYVRGQQNERVTIRKWKKANAAAIGQF